MKKLLLIIVLALMLVSVFVVTANATGVTEVTPETQVKLLDGTVLDIYDESGEGLIWFVVSTDESGVNTYASVPVNKITADNVSSYVTYNINSTYGTNQMHDIYIKYWNGESYVSIAESLIVVANLRTLEREYWSIGSVFSSSYIEYVFNSSTARSSGDYTGYTKLQLVDLSLTTNFTGFDEQAFKGCTSLREVRIGNSIDGFDITCKNGNVFNGCTSLTTVKFANTSCITRIVNSAFINCSSLTGTYVFPNVTTIEDFAFRYCATNEECELILHFPSIEVLGTSATDAHVFGGSGLKEIYFGDDLKSMKLHIFTDCKKLEKIEFKGAAQDFNFPSYTFNGCSALKAFSIPDGMTTLPGRMFLNCTSLKAVYLPSTLEKINSGSQDHSTFANCTNVYFVSEPFTFTSDEDIPAKPDVYYFPEGLTTLTGETFKNCKSLNNTLVFPKGVTTLSNAWIFEAGISNPTLENIVFLGDMENVTASSWKFTGKIYYANPNDISSDNVTISGASGKHIFCNAESNATHLFKVAVNTAPTCTVDGVNGYKCFCGKASDTAETVPALGHQKSEVKAITYNGVAIYFEKGDITYKCDRCAENHTVEDDAEALFNALGYTHTEAGKLSKAIMQSFGVNRKAIEKYNEYTENDIVNYGVIAATENGLAGVNDVFGDDGAANTAKVNVASYFGKSFDLIEMKLGGLEGKDGVSYEDAKLYCCAFSQIANGESVDSYYETKGESSAVIGTELSNSVSFNELVG